MKKAFLICPVRGHSADESRHIVKALEEKGWDVHFPFDDTNQEDPTGYCICCDNFEAIYHADRVFIIWDGKSQGCLFDAGMAFALDRLFGKPITVIELPELRGKKSYQDMITDWESRCE